jgi:two-component system response regulator NreC
MAAETSFDKPANLQTNIISIKIAIADDHQLFSGGISRMLNETDGLTVCATFLNGKALLDWYNGTNADVILIDIYMPVLNGIEASKQLLANFPTARIIILSADDDQHIIRLMHDIGVYGYVVKSAEPEDFIKTILKVHSAEKVFPEVLSVNIGNRNINKDKTTDAKLSDREIQVLRLIVNGKTNLQIAVELNISRLTVKKHRENLLRKMEVSNTAQMIAKAGLSGIFK